MTLPGVRKSAPCVQAVGEEILLYEAGTHRVLALNPTAAFLYQRLDGTVSLEQLADQVRQRFPEVGSRAREVVLLGLDRLRAEGVLEADPGPGLSRRHALTRLSAALLPLVVAAAVPAPAAAISCPSGCIGTVTDGSAFSDLCTACGRGGALDENEGGGGICDPGNCDAECAGICGSGVAFFGGNGTTCVCCCAAV